MTNAACYLRVSTEDQAEKYGLDVQRERCAAMVKVKGWTLAAVYSDEGISGTLDAAARPGLAALLAAACAGEIDAAIVLALDRLGRDTRLVLRLVEELDDCGVLLVSCNESLDTDTPAGRFVLRMFASLAELERDTIVARTTAGRDARGRVDGEKGGRVPLGYRRKPAGIVIDDGAAGTVRHIFSLRDGGATLAAVADDLNAAGILTARGHQWHASSVRAVLGNEGAYRGGYRGDSRVRWPAILPAV